MNESWTPAELRLLADLDGYRGVKPADPEPEPDEPPSGAGAGSAPVPPAESD